MTIAIILVVVSFCTATVDLIFGMGFGLSMTPILLLLDFEPHQIVPSVLLASLAGNILSPFLHHRSKNADFSFRSPHLKTALIVGLLGALGGFIGAITAINISDLVLTIYIGILVVSIGLLLLLSKTRTTAFTWYKLIGLGVFGSFNKGMSGSGFGPIITTGLIMMGTGEKAAVSIQSFSELFVSLAGSLTFVSLSRQMEWSLTVPLVIGVVLSTPVAVLIVQKANSRKLRWAIGYATVILGIVTLLTLVF
jgi:uncharacterized membrane protein YfcA